MCNLQKYLRRFKTTLHERSKKLVLLAGFELATYGLRIGNEPLYTTSNQFEIVLNILI
jgi:hypothetical protein